MVLLTAEEAQRFESERPAATAVIALSPAARAQLGEGSRKLLMPEPFTDWSHARVVARAHRASDTFNAALAANGSLRLGTRHGLGFVFLLHAYLVARIWETLRAGGPWLIPTAGDWERIDNRDEALARLTDHLGPVPPQSRPPPLPWLFRLLRRSLLWLLRSRGPWIVSRNPSLVFGLEHQTAIERSPLRILVCRIMCQGLWEYRELLQTFKDALSDRRAVRLAILGREDASSGAVVERALGAVKDPIIVKGLTERARNHFFHAAANSEGLFEDAVRVFKAVKPRCYVTRQDSGQFAAVADAAGSCGVPRFAVNYNSFPASDSALGRKMQETFFHIRMPQGLSDHYAIWSPHLAATARSVYDEATQRAMQPMRIAPTALNGGGRAAENGRRRVLYASNYTEYEYFLPWFMETSNEFIDDIVIAAERIRELEDVELTVRTKSKGECTPEIIRHFVQESERLRVTGTERRFEEALESADLLISYSSTTIEQGILHRIPVLLWGPVRRYLHLPACRVPPTHNSRSTIYAVSDAADLAPMVSAILDAHAGKPLTDDEIAEHVWPVGTPGVAETAQMIAEGRRVPVPA